MSEERFVREARWRKDGARLRILPAVGLFGANGSGKSNVLKVMDDMRGLVLHSFRHGHVEGGIGRRPFRLDERMNVEPSEFEVDLVLHGVRHTYGFVVNDDRVLKEWALHYPRGRAALLFDRNRDEVDFGPGQGPKNRAILELLRHNALFLSTAAQAKHPVLFPLYEWFGRNLLLAEADSRPFRQALTREMLSDDRLQDRILALLQAADLGVTGAVRHEPDPVMRERLRRAVRIIQGIEDEPEGDEGPAFDELGVRLKHRGQAGDVELDPDEESLGTRVWFGLIGPVVDALDSGSVFLADELDSSLHPALVGELVRLFQDPSSNPRRAQLIFNSHDVTLLDVVGERLLGRDQIWFTEKSGDGSTRLYPLTDLSPRKNEALAKRYLEGRYGATPILSPHEFAAASELLAATKD